MRGCVLITPPLFLFADNCNGPLLSMLPHSSFQGSSQSSGAHAAHNAKLNRRDGESTSVFVPVAAPGPPAVPAVGNEPKR